jgi:hypothetical protein
MFETNETKQMVFSGREELKLIRGNESQNSSSIRLSTPVGVLRKN